MERRSSVRRQIQLDADLSVNGEFVGRGQIADFCPEGMFVKYPNEVGVKLSSLSHENPELQVVLEFDEPGTIFHYQVFTHPVHLLENAMGVMFVKSCPEAISGMLRICSSATRRSSLKAPTDNVAFILQKCVQAVKDYVIPLLPDFYQDLEAQIKEAALKAPSDQLANEIMEAVNIFNRTQRELSHRVIKKLDAPLEMSGAVEAGKTRVNDPSLSLVEKNEFEDWLITRVLITRTETQFHGLLLQLKLRLDAIGVANQTGQQNPLGPALIVNAFHSAIAMLNLNKVLEKLVFRVLEEQLLAGLEPLLVELNEIFVRQNILPELDIKKHIKKKASPPSKTKSSERNEQQKEQEKKQPIGKNNGGNSPQYKSTDASRPVDSSNSSPSTKTSSSDNSSLRTPAQDGSISGQAADQNTSDSQNMVMLDPPFVGVSQSEPDAAKGKDSAPAPASASAAGDSVTSPQDSSEVQAEGSRAEQAHANIMSLIQNLRAKSQSAMPPGKAEKHAAMPDWSSSELGSELDALQMDAASSAVDSAPDADDSLRQRVMDKLSAKYDAEKKIPEQQEVAFDVVDRFFATMKNTRMLSKYAKKQLKQLEVPVMKVYMRNEQLFEDTSHAVHEVLNRIAQLGSYGLRLNPKTQSKIDELIQKINTDFEDDLSIFEHVREELNHLVQRQNDVYRKNVERVAAAADGAQRLEFAEEKVNQALQSRLDNRQIPTALATLLDSGWRELLRLTYLKQGESEDWRRYVAVVDSLQNCVENPEHKPDLASLLSDVKSGLAEVSGSGATSSSLREELKKLLQAENGEMPELTHYKQASSSLPVDIEEQNTKRSRAMHHWVRRAKKLVPGDWLSWHKSENEVQFLRLVWIAKGFTKFVFVNHQGMKVVELGLLKLADYLKSGAIAPEPDYEVPFVTRSLENMVRSVYEKLAFEAGHDSATGLPKGKEFLNTIRMRMAKADKFQVFTLLAIRFSGLQQAQSAPGSDASSDYDSLMTDIKRIIETYAVSKLDIGWFSREELGVLIPRDGVDALRIKYVEELQAIVEESVYKGKIRVQAACTQGKGKSQGSRIMVRDVLLKLQAQQTGKSPEDEQLQSSGSVADDDTGSSADQGSSKTEKSRVKLSLVENVGSQYFQDVPFEEVSESEREFIARKVVSAHEATRLSHQYELAWTHDPDKRPYVPLSKSDSSQMDQWWLSQLKRRNSNEPGGWHVEGPLRVSLSAYALFDDDWADTLLALIEKGEVEPKDLWFDIYDAVLINNLFGAADMMSRLIEKGCRFCLDHFGSTRSPYLLLKVLPVELVKLDETFIYSLEYDYAETSLLESVIEVAHHMGKEVLAPMVNTLEVEDALRNLGVDYLQGDAIDLYTSWGKAGD